MNKRNFILLAISTALAATPMAQAQNRWGESFTPEQAQKQRQEGQVKPLRDILKQLKSRYGGYHLDANLYNRGSGQVYVIDWMSEKGQRMQLTVDAKTGRVLSSK